MISVSSRHVPAALAMLGALLLFAGCKNASHRSTVAVTPPAIPAPVISATPARSNVVEVVPKPPPASSADTVGTDVLLWDAKKKSYQAKPGEESAPFTFNLRNVSAEELVIYAAETTCGCTVAQLPATPWRIPPGDSGKLAVTMDLRGKQGTQVKQVTVFTSKGNSLLTVEVAIP